jgi:hypothetical protein
MPEEQFEQLVADLSEGADSTPLEQFQEKCEAVFRPELRKTKD